MKVETLVLFRNFEGSPAELLELTDRFRVAAVAEQQPQVGHPETEPDSLESVVQRFWSKLGAFPHIYSQQMRLIKLLVRRGGVVSREDVRRELGLDPDDAQRQGGIVAGVQNTWSSVAGHRSRNLIAPSVFGLSIRPNLVAAFRSVIDQGSEPTDAA